MTDHCAGVIAGAPDYWWDAKAALLDGAKPVKVNDDSPGGGR